MQIDIHTCKPERIEDLVELDDVLKRLDIYHKEYAPEASEVGVLMMQTRQFGAAYRIKSREEAEIEMSKSVVDDGKGSRTCEWGIKFYPRSYFEMKKERILQ